MLQKQQVSAEWTPLHLHCLLTVTDVISGGPYTPENTKRSLAVTRAVSMAAHVREKDDPRLTGHLIWPAGLPKEPPSEGSDMQWPLTWLLYLGITYGIHICLLWVKWTASLLRVFSVENIHLKLNEISADIIGCIKVNESPTDYDHG